ncbi:MAG: hypothetical protein ACR2HS_06655, partial [Gammaproteobacteria bacterium]
MHNSINLNITNTDVVHLDIIEGSNLNKPYISSGNIHVAENAQYQFNNNSISISNVQSNIIYNNVTITSTNGTIKLTNTTGLNLSPGNTSTSINISGSINDINNALNNLIFTPNANFRGVGSISISSTSYDPYGTYNTGTNTVYVTVDPVNQAPTSGLISTLTGTVTVNQNSSVKLNYVAIRDPDDNGSELKITLKVENGLLTINNLSTFSVKLADGTSATNSSTITLVGTKTALNDCILNGGVMFTPNKNFYGNATFTVVTNDLGNTGSGCALTNTTILNIIVLPVNQAPRNIIPIDQVINENTNLIFSVANGNAINAMDIDAKANEIISVALSSTNGIISLINPTNVTLLSGSTGIDASSFTIQGTIKNINIALNNGVMFKPNANFSGAASITVVTNDFATTDTDTVNIIVKPVEVKPINNLPLSLELNENSILAFTSPNTISVSEPNINVNIVINENSLL